MYHFMIVYIHHFTQMVSQHHPWSCENGGCSPFVSASFPSPFSTCSSGEQSPLHMKWFLCTIFHHVRMVRNHHLLDIVFKHHYKCVQMVSTHHYIGKMVSGRYSLLCENGDHSPFVEYGFQLPFFNVFKWWALTMGCKIVPQHHLSMSENDNYSPF
jgi:hypothetical protein